VDLTADPRPVGVVHIPVELTREGGATQRLVDERGKELTQFVDEIVVSRLVQSERLMRGTGGLWRLGHGRKPYRDAIL
jgi:hypothetical protein